MKYINISWFLFLGYCFARLAGDGWFPFETNILTMSPGQSAALVISHMMVCMAIFFIYRDNK